MTDPEGVGLTGAFWLALAQRLDEAAPLVSALPMCAEGGAVLRRQLLQLLHYHSGVRVFRTRQLMRDVQALTPRV